MDPPLARTQDIDAPIRATDNDAAVARLSAVQKQYLHDPWIKYLVPRAHLQPPRPPLINIGTYVRSTAIDELVDQWMTLAESIRQKFQIISLGAGSDTRFWRIATGIHKESLATYVEIDFPEITSKKAMAIRKNKELGVVLGDSSEVHLVNGGTALHAPKYHLLSADLRLPPSDSMQNLLASSSDDRPSIISPSLPTLLLFECVLVYMSPAASSKLLKWFVDHFSTPRGTPGSILGCIVYEMFGLNDSFGQVMVNNLKSRHVCLPGAEPFTTIESLPRRFLSTGFTSAYALTLKDIRRSYTDSNELARIARLEMLDEIEELELVLQHYAISWGLLLSNPASAVDIWSQWALKSKMSDIQSDRDE